MLQGRGWGGGGWDLRLPGSRVPRQEPKEASTFCRDANSHRGRGTQTLPTQCPAWHPGLVGSWVGGPVRWALTWHQVGRSGGRAAGSGRPGRRFHAAHWRSRWELRLLCSARHYSRLLPALRRCRCKVGAEPRGRSGRLTGGAGPRGRSRRGFQAGRGSQGTT